MAFFKLFKKKKKEAGHKELKGASPSLPATPQAPSAIKVGSSSNNSPSTGRAAGPQSQSIRDESMYTKGTVVDHQRGTTTTVERIASPAMDTSTAASSSLRQFEANQAAIDLTRSLVKRFIADIWNRGEVDLIPEVCSPSLRFNGNTGFDRVGHEGLARMVNTIREALDDYHCEIHSMVVENNKAFCRLRFTGE